MVAKRIMAQPTTVEDRVLVQARVPAEVHGWLMEKSAYETISVAGVIRRMLLDAYRADMIFTSVTKKRRVRA